MQCLSAIIGGDHVMTMEGGLSEACAGHDARYGHGVTQQQEGG